MSSEFMKNGTTGDCANPYNHHCQQGRAKPTEYLAFIAASSHTSVFIPLHPRSSSHTAVSSCPSPSFEPHHSLLPRISVSLPFITSHRPVSPLLSVIIACIMQKAACWAAFLISSVDGPRQLAPCPSAPNCENAGSKSPNPHSARSPA